MAAEVAIAICPGKATCGLVEDEPVVRELLTQLRDLSCPTDDLGSRGAVADDFCPEGIVSFLLHGPVDALRVDLVVSEEKLLMTIEGRAQEFVGTSMEMFCMDGTTATTSAQQLRAGCTPVDHDKGGDFVAIVI